jgi:hypothetical protein
MVTDAVEDSDARLDDAAAEHLEQYAGGPAELDAALSGLADAELDLAPPEGGWSIRQLVHHVVDGDDLWAMPIKAALAAPGCAFAQDWYETTNTAAETLDYAGRAVAPSLALFCAHRAHIVQLVQHLPGALERHVEFTHHWYGAPQTVRITAGEMIAMQARHATAHTAEIAAIRRARAI